MSDKDFWTEVYLHAVKEFISKINYVDLNDIKHSVNIADDATKCFKEKMKSFAKEAKSDIKKKEEIKESNKQRFK